jgi:hypothetical protein
MTPDDINSLHGDLSAKLLLRLQLPYMRAHYHELAQTAAATGNLKCSMQRYLKPSLVTALSASILYNHLSCVHRLFLDLFVQAVQLARVEGFGAIGFGSV